MQTRRKETFSTIKTEGAILPPDILQRIADGDTSLNGLSPESYHLAKNERLNEAVNRSWNRLLGAWESFHDSAEKLPESDAGTTLTRERWLLILFQELGYGRLQTSKAFEIDGRTYPISHIWQNAPIHLVSFKLDMDRPASGVRGAARVSPHSLLQEFLNRSDDYLWGLVSNGHKMRLLRDNISLTRNSYVEFDLEAMMEGEVYSDFILLWLVAHQSRVEVPDGKTPEHCWLEKWFNTAAEEGTRVLESLREGVQAAIETFGKGFLAHQNNNELREKLRSGELSTQEYYRQILRLVYRLLFLFVAEDRGLLLDPKADEKIREMYYKYYSTQRIRTLADKQRGTRHPDLFLALRLVMSKIHNGCPELGITALGSMLFSEKAMPDIEDIDIANHDLLDAIRHLAYTIDRNVRRPVDYRNLGSEELGSVYESLLELHPEINIEANTFELKVVAGSERKTTGSYYTPTSLVNCLLESALDPVLNEACKKDDPEKALLNLKVCDPACGSGHFLIAAAHRMAKRLAAIRSGAEEPSPESVRHALRDIVGHCIYGVDLNPMAVELCKVNLWMEAIEPGKPLSFLDHHIKRGNSLLGATPALLDKGIPDDVFKPIEGDDKAICRDYKKKNREERKGQLSLLDAELKPWERLGNLAASMMNVDDIDDNTLDGIQKKQQRYQELVSSGGYLNNKLWADAWCAAFVWKKNREFDYPITEEIFRKIERNPHSISKWMNGEIQRLANQYSFFHWHLEFPDVFCIPGKSENPDNTQAGWIGGFDVVLGNPPWERIKLQEKEWFASRRPDIANAPNAATRRRMIAALEDEDPALYSEFLEDRRKAEGESHFVRNSERFPLCGRGDVNTYTIFAETKRIIINLTGRVGCIVPSGIATDDTTKFFFQDLMDTRSLVSLYDFENREGIFQGVHRSYKFCLLTLTGYSKPAEKGTEFIFFAHKTQQLHEEERRFTLSSEEIELLNPNTKTCPIFRSKRDAELTKSIYRRVPVLIKEGPPEENSWGIKFSTMFHMANDSHLFRTRDQLENDGWQLDRNVFEKGDDSYVPLYEAKMIHQFDHRFGTYESQTEAQANQGKLPELDTSQHNNSNLFIRPRYWVSSDEIETRLKNKWNRPWLFGWRNITSAVTVRTVIASILPRVGVGHSYPLIFTDQKPQTTLLLLCNMSVFILDYAARQKIGGINLTYGYINQFPVLPPSAYDTPCPWLQDKQISHWLYTRILELVFTAWDLEPFAKDCGYGGPPFKWDEERRFLIRCEIDAAYFHLYGIERDDLDYIMETFPIVKRKDEKKYSEYRTKRQILEIYDGMANSIRTGTPYQTLLDPPPADPRVAHPPERIV